MAIINGKRVTIPTPIDIEGNKLKKYSNLKENRRMIIEKNDNSFETIKDEETYSLDDYSKISEIPDRTKGNYFEIRSEISKAIIKSQIIDLGNKLFKNQNLQMDENNCDWLIVPEYKLPKNWHYLSKKTPLLIVFPQNYPSEPPVGFYLKEQLKNSPNGHFYQEAYHNAAKEPLKFGWKWYCVYILKKSWQPSSIKHIEDWRKGDNLWTYFQLIAEVLESSEN
ncbi:E2 family protein E [Cetobacterium ceti]|uniref:E2 family protein E n=1 Tax=Cetobacterium ceti TaxID=180163 RepID=A0A1T4K4R1_9FUSO|nr:E2/UBC family protein [Cetobacterium ceti]SJZ37430.1 E2 family protein E [Cetobacterium ceti]